MKYFFFVILTLLMAASAYAQEPEKAQKEALKKLAWLIGEWEGAGSINMGGGNKNSITVHESVRFDLDSTVILFNGKGFQQDSATNANRKGHDAFAVVSYNIRDNKYRWNAWRIPGGTYNEVEIIPGDKSFEWSAMVQGGQTRFKTYMNAMGQWVETGEFSRDGQKWTQFMIMTLDKAN